MSCTTYNNRLEVFKGNTKQLFCTVYDSSDNLMDLSSYTAGFYAKKYPVTPSSTVDISVGHTVIDASGFIIFNLSSTDTSINKGDYTYEIIIEKTGTKITVLQDTMNVIDSIK